MEGRKENLNDAKEVSGLKHARRVGRRVLGMKRRPCGRTVRCMRIAMRLRVGKKPRILLFSMLVAGVI